MQIFLSTPNTDKKMSNGPLFADIFLPLLLKSTKKWRLADVIAFLKGCAPVFAAFIGLICLFIGAADIKDKKEAKKEESTKIEE